MIKKKGRAAYHFPIYYKLPGVYSNCNSVTNRNSFNKVSRIMIIYILGNQLYLESFVS